jgi:hypothetical protein
VPPPKPAHLLRSACEATSTADGASENDEAGCVGVAATGVSTDRVCARVWQVRGGPGVSRHWCSSEFFDLLHAVSL